MGISTELLLAQHIEEAVTLHSFKRMEAEGRSNRRFLRIRRLAKRAAVRQAIPPPERPEWKDWRVVLQMPSHRRGEKTPSQQRQFSGDGIHCRGRVAHRAKTRSSIHQGPSSGSSGKFLLTPGGRQGFWFLARHPVPGVPIHER